MSNSKISTNNMNQPKFIITATPACYIRPITPLTPQIDISRDRQGEFNEPLFVTLNEDDIQLSEEYLRELQAQGVDKLVDALQAGLDFLHERDCVGAVTLTLKDEINSCKAFADRLRNSIIKSGLCGSCNDWPRGGCSSTCSAYDKESNHE